MLLAQIEKEWVNKHNHDINAGIQAWDSAAGEDTFLTIPSFSDNPFLQFVNKHIKLEPDMCSLDIGCGAGVYSFALSEKIKSVTGTDLSPNMIDKANMIAKEKGISNAEFFCENWYELDVSKWERKFDIVFAHMTPAIVDYNTFMKMNRCSKKYCFMEKPVRREHEIMNGLKKIAGLDDQAENDDGNIIYAFATLWKMGCCPEFAYRQNTWVSSRPLDKAYPWYIGRLKTLTETSAEIEKKLYEYLQSIAVDGEIHDTSCNTIVSIFWEVPN